MNTKLSQDYITLELHKILDMLANEAANEKTKELARALTPDRNGYRSTASPSLTRTDG